MKFGEFKKFAPASCLPLGAFVILLGLNIFIFHEQIVKAFNPPKYPEAAEILTKHNFDDLSPVMKEIADKKGAVYAFDLLEHAPLPVGVDQHLLGHIIGGELYKQKGLKGMYDCTPALENACSHSIVTGYLEEHGKSALADIGKICETAPGGKGAYDQCFHGLGHGVLAINDYDLRPTVTMCESLKTGNGSRGEDINCMGGATMEMVGGGFHDKEAWIAQQKVYFKSNDPLYPCDGNWVPSRLKPICYIFLTPHLFASLNTTIFRAGPKEYAKAMEFCNRIPKTDDIDRNACYVGFGKEFAGIGIGRDIREVNSAPDSGFSEVYQWCMLASDPKGQTACILTVLGSYYWGGENSPQASIRYCNQVTDIPNHNACFSQLIGSVAFFKQDSGSRKDFCNLISDPYKNQCSTRLLRVDNAKPTI